jgi:hypothetical protein
MARRKKKVHHRRRRSSRVGAIDVKKIAMKVAGVSAGAFVARTLNNVVVKQFPTLLSGWMIGLGDVAIGALVPKFIKSDLGVAIGDGFVAIGALTAMQGLGVISGSIGNTNNSGGKVPTRVIGAGDRPFLSRMVGATGRPYLRQMVGRAGMGNAYSEMERMNRQAMGSAIGSLAIEE